MQENKQIVLVALVIILPIVLVFGVNKTNEYIEKRDMRLINSSLANLNVDNCFKVFNKDRQNQCLLELAKKMQDMNICEGIEARAPGSIPPDITFGLQRHRKYGNLREECKNEVQNAILKNALISLSYADCRGNQECEYQIVLRLNDSSRCRHFTDNIDSCFLEVGKAIRNITLCELINTTDQRKTCYSFFSDFVFNETICDLTHEDKVPLCYYRIALNKSKASLCDKSGQYQSECYYKLALKENNINYCGKSQEKMGSCTFTIAKNLNKPTYCFNANELSGECWNFFALNHSNAELCELSVLRDTCYLSIASQTKNRELCDRASSKRNDCWHKLAVIEREPEICFKINSSSGICSVGGYADQITCRELDDDVSSCIYFSSLTNLDYCHYISKEYYVARCYRNVAVETTNLQACDLAKRFRPNCYYEIAMRKKDVRLCREAGPWEIECLESLQKIT